MLLPSFDILYERAWTFWSSCIWDAIDILHLQCKNFSCQLTSKQVKSIPTIIFKIRKYGTSLIANSKVFSLVAGVTGCLLECPKSLKMFKLDLTWSSRSGWTWTWPDLNLLKQNLTWPELEVSSQVFFGFPEKNLIFFLIFSIKFFSQEYATTMNF